MIIDLFSPLFQLRWLKWCLGLLLSAILVLALYVYLPVIISPADEYLSRKGQLIAVKTTKVWQKGDSEYSEMELLSTSGLKVELLVRKPISQSGSLPVALILGGIGTGRNACLLVGDIKHVVCASLSYPYSGDRRMQGIGYLSNLRHVQRAVKDTPPAILLVVDYLSSVRFIDKEQIELLGVSFGAYFASVPAVLDDRISRLWIAHGSAEPMKVMAHNIMKDSDSVFMKNLLGYAVGYAIGAQHVDPSKWIGKVSPKPVVIINADRDATFPASSVKAMHDAAVEPKEIFWTKGVHISPNRKDIIRQLRTIVMNRIALDYNNKRHK